LPITIGNDKFVEIILSKISTNEFAPTELGVIDLILRVWYEGK
jgi:hypothetical protein